MSKLRDLQMRDAFITGIIAEAYNDKDIVFISNDFGAPALDKFREEYPEQFINAGISEQNIISVAAGLAKSGKKVFIYSIATFIILRCFEQIKLDLCLHKASVTIIAVGVGYAYAMDGPTHHTCEYVALLRTLAGLNIFSPADSIESHELVKRCIQIEGPNVVCLDKGDFPSLEEILINRGEGTRSLNNSSDLVILSLGSMTHKALKICRALEQSGLCANVMQLSQIKPLSEKFIANLERISKLVTIEEHCYVGGIGSLAAECIADANSETKLLRCAIDENLSYSYGTRNQLHAMHELDVDAITAKILKWLHL